MDAISLCKKHNKNYGNFCSICAEFLCYECECPHYLDQKLVPLGIIIKYINASKYQNGISPEKVDSLKKQLTALFTNSLECLTIAFQNSLQYFDQLSACKKEFDQIKKKLEDHGVHDNSFAIINSIAHQLETPQENYIQIYYDKVAELIKNVESIAQSFDLNTHPKNQCSAKANGILHYWKGPNIVIRDLKTNEEKKYKLKQSINSYADSIEVSGKIFVIGGYANGPIADTFEIDLNNSTLKEKGSMLSSKYYHVLCSINPYIYSLGGYKTDAIDDCEKYDSINNKWSNLPNLNTQRYFSCGFSFSQLYVYIFAGFNGKGSLNSMERLNHVNPLKWENIEVENVCNGRCEISAIQINAKEVLIFGGGDPKGGKGESFIMTISDKVRFTKIAAINNNALFYSTSTPAFDGKCVYAVDYDKRLHKYSLENQKWTFTQLEIK